MSITLKIFGLIGGLILFLGAIFDWDFVVNGRREQRARPLISRTATRILYGFSGLVGVVLVIFLLFSPIIWGLEKYVAVNTKDNLNLRVNISSGIIYLEHIK